MANRSIDDMIAVMTAFKEGKEIEVCINSEEKPNKWIPASDPNWDWDEYTYRIKRKKFFDSFGIKIKEDDMIWVWDDDEKDRSLAFLKNFNEKERYPYLIVRIILQDSYTSFKNAKKYIPGEKS